MSTQTEVRPKPAHGGTGDDVPFHYVKKADIAESAVLGTTVTALCGATFPVTRDPKPGARICPACKAIKEGQLGLS